MHENYKNMEIRYDEGDDSVGSFTVIHFGNSQKFKTITAARKFIDRLTKKNFKRTPAIMIGNKYRTGTEGLAEVEITSVVRPHHRYNFGSEVWISNKKSQKHWKENLSNLWKDTAQNREIFSQYEKFKNESEMIRERAHKILEGMEGFSDGDLKSLEVETDGD